MQCTAKTKRTGEQCKSYAVKGRKTCRMHGGTKKEGPASPSFKHGAYSRHMKKLVGDLIEEVRNDPELMNLDGRVAEMSALRLKCQELLAEKSIPILPNMVKLLTDLIEKEAKVIEKKAKIEAMVKHAGIGDFTVKDFVQIVIAAEAVARKKLALDVEVIDVTPIKKGVKK